MDKLLTYNSIEPEHKQLFLLRNGGSLIKQADADMWLPEIRHFINNMIPEEDHIYTLCNALGAGEFWSSNVNGDYFPEKALIKKHDTFVQHGLPYMMHINKDPKKSYGKVLASAYNPKMHRVELVVGYDRNKLPAKYIKKIESDENVNLSMGCRVPYDICSICGNVAPTPSQYCDCIKRYGLNHVYDDGRKLYVINTDPQFFDISIVIVPADKTARILERIDPPNGKVASARETITLEASSKTTKTASVKSKSVQSGYTNLLDLLPDLSEEDLEKVAMQTKNAETFIASIKQAQQYFKPHEVQAILAMQQGNTKLARYLIKTRHFIEANIKELPNVKQAAPVPLPNLRTLHNIKQAMVTKVADGNVTPSMAITPDVLAGKHGYLSQMTALANMAALAGSVMGMNVNTWIPIILGTANAANFIASKANTPPVANIPPQRDLMLAPLIYAKEACDMSLKEQYTLPIITALQEQDKNLSWEKTAENILKEGILRLKAKKIIKDSSYT